MRRYSKMSSNPVFFTTVTKLDRFERKRTLPIIKLSHMRSFTLQDRIRCSLCFALCSCHEDHHSQVTTVTSRTSTTMTVRSPAPQSASPGRPGQPPAGCGFRAWSAHRTRTYTDLRPSHWSPGDSDSSSTPGRLPAWWAAHLDPSPWHPDIDCCKFDIE
jgi:hypothetical protein